MGKRENRIRAFIAIELPGELKAAVREAQAEMKSFGINVRWVRAENIHLTLKFLGDIREEDIDQIYAVMKESVAGFSPIPLSGKGVGVFPNLRRPRVVWVGVGREGDRLIELQEALDQGLKEIGFPREKRAFKGHLTMGRVKGRVDIDALKKAIQAYSDFASAPFSAGEIILFQSDLRPSGAVYTKLRKALFH